MTDATPSQGVPGRHITLCLLVLVYILNFLDRQILSILAVPIKTEFGLSDADMGWLMGLAFGAVYSILAIPAAWLADRTSRVWIMTGALAIWSGFTALCGLAGSYTHLFIARIGVGVGEAGGVAPAYALISDLYPSGERARAIAVFSFGIPIGAASGVLFGGLVAAAIDWRYAFIFIGVAGLLLAPVFRLLVKEPPRSSDRPAMPSLWAVARLAATKPSFWLLALGAGFTSLVGYGLMAWLPAFLVRSLRFDLIQTSWYLAGIILFGGLIGMSLGGSLADRLGKTTKAAYPLIPAAALVVSALLYGIGTVAAVPAATFVLFLLAQALGLTWFGPIVTAVQHLGPAPSRSQMSALFLLITNLIGLGLGPWFFGQVSDVLRPVYGDDSLRWAFLWGLGFYLLAALLLFAASKTLKRDWVEDAPSQ